MVDNDTTRHDVHTYTVAFSPSALIKYLFLSSDTDALRDWLKKAIHGIRHTVISFHHGSVVIGDLTRDVSRCALRAQGSLLDSLLCRGQLAGRAQLCCRVLWWIVVAGPLLRVELVFGETQEEHLSGIRWNVVITRIAEVERPGMSMTTEQVVTQLQQELLTLRAQVAAESGLADAVRAINNLATAHVRKDTPSLIDVKGLGRPKEFSSKEEDFQQWSKKTEAFFARVFKESEMMWAAEQATEITTTAVNLESFPTDTKVDRGVQNLEFVLQQMHTASMTLTSHELNDTVANSRKNPLET